MRTREGRKVGFEPPQAVDEGLVVGRSTEELAASGGGRCGRVWFVATYNHILCCPTNMSRQQFRSGTHSLRYVRR